MSNLFQPLQNQALVIEKESRDIVLPLNSYKRLRKAVLEMLKAMPSCKEGIELLDAMNEVSMCKYIGE